VTEQTQPNPKAEAQHLYHEAFERHATAEQLAAFWGQPDEAATHRVALEIALRCGDEEVHAKPLVKGAW
jgi:hypothetical protein